MMTMNNARLWCKPRWKWSMLRLKMVAPFPGRPVVLVGFRKQWQVVAIEMIIQGQLLGGRMKQSKPQPQRVGCPNGQKSFMWNKYLEPRLWVYCQDNPTVCLLFHLETCPFIFYVCNSMSIEQLKSAKQWRRCDWSIRFCFEWSCGPKWAKFVLDIGIPCPFRVMVWIILKFSVGSLPLWSVL